MKARSGQHVRPSNRRYLLLVLEATLAAALVACAEGTSDERPRGLTVRSTQQPLSQAPDTNCAAATFDGHEYWFCETNRSWSSARSQCQSQGLDLARIDDVDENDFIFANLTNDTWLGGTDASAEGAWFWIDNTTQFWSATTGTSVGGRYTSWNLFQPDNWFNQDCAAIEVLAFGQWADRACTETLNFVCERALAPDEAEVECETDASSAVWPAFRRCLGNQATTSFVGPRSTDSVFTYETDGDVESSPAIGPDGRIYVGSSDGYLYAINRDMTLAWRYQTGGAVRSSPALAPDGTIYVGSSDGKVYALSPTGSKKWDYATGAAVRSSPAVGTNGIIYVGSDNSKLYALSAAGAKLWEVDTNAYVRSSPAIGPDGTIYVGLEDWNVVAINPNGSTKWYLGTTGPVTSSPAIGQDGTIFVGCYDGYLYALHPGSGALKWSYSTGYPITSSPAIARDGTIIFGNDEGLIYGLDPDGGLAWSYPTSGAVTSSPAIGLDGIAYVGSTDDSVYALRVADGSLLWELETDGDVWSSPAIGRGGVLYVGSYDDALYAIGLADGCPTDATKIVPGSCGCGVADADTDSDGVLNCFDECPNDPAKTVAGDCGCADAPASTSTACDDGLCPANNLCNGAGACGSPSQCTSPDTSCTAARFAGSSYWFCTTDRAYAAARTRCQSAGMDLAKIETASEDSFVTSTLTEQSIIGASDQTVEGTWRWSDTQAQFWTGDESGSASGGRYANWMSLEPSDSLTSLDCATKVLTSSGKWKAVSCSTAYGYVCEATDGCPDDVNKKAAGECGCGVPDTDSDDDGTPDCEETCDSEVPLGVAGHFRKLQCDAPSRPACRLRVQAKANHDRQAAAKLYMAKLMDPSEHVAVTRDRGRKLADARASSSLLQAICDGDDDGDLVPNTLDQCPNTRELRPTDDFGCEIFDLPKTAHRFLIDAHLANLGIVYDPRCEGADTPPMPLLGPGPGVYSRIASGKYVISIHPIDGQPEDCELQYQFEVFITRADGSRNYATLSFSSQNDSRVTHESFRTWFDIDSSRDTEEKMWGPNVDYVDIRARVMNGNGQRSAWSPLQHETIDALW